MKCKRFLISIITTLSILLSVSVSAGAVDESKNYDAPESFVAKQISIIDQNESVCPWNENTEISSTIVLYSMDNVPNGYVFNLSTGNTETGFIQIHAIDGEYSIYCYAYEGKSEVECMAEYWNREIAGEKIYFIGSFKYLIDVEGEFWDLASNTPVSLTENQLLTMNEEYATQIASDALVVDVKGQHVNARSATPRGSDDDYYWPITSDFSNMTITYNGTTHNGITDHCSPTAATGIIRYMNHIGRTSCTSGETTSATFEKLYIALNTNDIRFNSIGDSSGTKWAQIAVGLRWYANNNNCALTIEQSNFNTFNSMKQNLDAGRLLQVEVTDFGGTSGGHSIVVTGYSSNTLYIQNGWTRNYVTYSYSSLDIVQYVYIG